jgi:hypothetical protein
VRPSASSETHIGHDLSARREPTAPAPQPVPIAELEVIHAPLVLPPIAALGHQPLAALAGAWLATASEARG